MSIELLKQTELFQHMSEPEIRRMMTCLGARTQAYPPGEILLHPGEQTTQMGVLLEGQLQVQMTDAWGQVSVIRRVEAGELFAEVYALVKGSLLLVTVVAVEASRVMWLDLHRTIRVCSNVCEAHQQLIEQLMYSLARKNLQLSRKIDHTTPKSIRGRVQAYLSDLATQKGSRAFEIPFDRQGMADYLNVERSALSAELSRMRKEGLLDFHRNHFELPPEA